MIIDLDRFVREEKPRWVELEKMLNTIEADPYRRMDFHTLRRFHYLYQRASGALSKIATLSAERELGTYLESLVARAYGEIHDLRERPHRFSPMAWFLRTFPRTFRKYFAAFVLAVAVTVGGAAFGAAAIGLDPGAKTVLIPFGHLGGDPSDRVENEERGDGAERLQGHMGQFSSMLMTHNTRVAIFTLALGMTWGVGTLILLFYNGVILGAVSLDYISAGETEFLLGWLLPHGVVEIPAILIAGQAGLVLARALIGWDVPLTLKARLKWIAGDLVTLIGGVAVMLVWAGLVEAFFSQLHEPFVSYSVKIGFGCVELLLLAAFLSMAGTGESKSSGKNAGDRVL